MRPRSLAKATLASLFSSIVGVVLLEIGLRVYSLFFFPKMMVLDEKLGWRHAANVRRVFVNEYGESALVIQNAHGHRGPLRDFAHRERRYRVLVLGDSFTEGVQVGEEDLFTAQLERELPDIEFINAGVGGYGTVQEYLFLASEGLKYSPDLVLLMFFENDLSDNCLSYYPGFGPRPYGVVRSDGVHVVEELDPSEFTKFLLPAPFRLTLNAHSYLYYYLNSRIYHRLDAGAMRQAQRLDMRKTSEGDRTKVFLEILDRMQGLLRTGNIDLLVALIPKREELAKREGSTVEAVAELCRAKGVAHLSLLERFAREDTSDRHLYFPQDMHWTRDGHRIAAGEIGSSLASSFLTQRKHAANARAHTMRSPQP